MATVAAPRSDTDTESAVDAAFGELDCCSQRKHEVPCGGPIRAFQEHHDCVQGWLCQIHYQNAIDVVLPQRKAELQDRGWVGCIHCCKRFTDIRKFVRYYPL